MNNKIFYPIINDLYYYLNIDSKLSNIEKKCNKKANEMLLDNIKKDLSDILYNGCIECFVDYFHYLKKSGFIKGIEHEQRLSEFQEIMSSKDEGINNFFSRYSGLNDSLEKKIQLTISIIEEILYRYEIDKNIIKDKFKINGNIISIKHSLGDYHNGKTVCLLKFEKGLVVYKPRNSFVDELYNDLLDIVSKNDIQMMKIETINRDDYSWHEYISHYECSNMEQVHRFYYRAGVNLAIFYAIGTNDIHYENLISSGEYPMIIDLETIMHGIVSKKNHSKDFNDLGNSALVTGMLPIYSSEGVFDISVSALFTDENHSKKLKNYILVEDENEDLVYKIEYAKLISDKNSVKLNGKQVPFSVVQEDIISGFEETLNLIIKKSQEIIEILEKYANKSIVIRQLLRPTYVYYKFISACESPEAMINKSMKNDIYQLFVNKFDAGKFGFLRVQEELNEMKKGFIPSFYTYIESRDLLMNGKVVCENYYDVSPLECAKSKILSLNEISIKNQIRYIKMTLTSLISTSDLIGGISKDRQKNKLEKINSNWAKEELKRYMKELLEQCIDLQDGNSYINLLIPLIEDNDKFGIIPFSYDLYFSMGIILLMCEYGKRADYKYVIESKRLLNTLINKFEKNIEDEEEKINYSLFSGVGGYIYTLFHVLKITKDHFYKDKMEFAIKKLMYFYYIKDMEKSDLEYLGGFCGSLYLLQKLYKYDKNILEGPLLDILEDKYIELLQKHKNDFEVVGMGHGISGVCLPLCEIVSKRKENIDLICKLLEKENTLIEKDDDLQYKWCRGHSGLILSRTIINTTIGGILKDKNNVIFKNMRSLEEKENIVQMLSMNNMSLCHGVYGNIDILLSLGYIGKYRDFILEKRFNHINEIKWIKGTDYSWDNFMLGNSGVAYTLLRVFYDDVPSILNLDL